MPGPIFEHTASPLTRSNDGQLQAVRVGLSEPLAPVYEVIYEVIDSRAPTALIRTYNRILIDAYIAGYDRAVEAVTADLRAEVKAALEGDSNDAEHDALVSVAQTLGIDYTPSDD